MKSTIKILLPAIAIMMLCSFQCKGDKIQRRKVVMNSKPDGSVSVVPISDWEDFTPVNDTLYQIRTNIK